MNLPRSGTFAILMFKFPPLRPCIILTTIMFSVSACTAQLSGKAKEDSTWSFETRQLESEAAAYAGPRYSVGIVPFDDKAAAPASGVEVISPRINTQLETAGLEVITVDDSALREAEKPKALQPAGAAKNGKRPTDNGLEAPDFRLSGAITSYSKADEGGDANTAEKKTVVARVALDYVLIDSTTGKQLIAESASGEFRKPSSGAPGLAARSSFEANLHDGALRNAYAKATVSIIRKLGSMPFQGKLLAVDGSSLVLKAGLRSQLKEGTQLAVYRVSKALVDPDNGRVLAYKESRIGVIQISKHLNENLSLAAVVSGSGFHAGDMAKPIP